MASGFGNARLDPEGAGFRRDRRVHRGDAPGEGLLRKGVDRGPHRLADPDEPGLHAGDRQLQAQRVDLEERDDGGRRLHVLAERDAALADVAGERRHDRDIGDDFLGERQLRPRLCDRGPGGVDVLHRRLGARARLIRDRDRDVAGCLERRVALRRRLRQGVLRFGELEVGLGAADRRSCFVEPQPGIDALQTDEHRAFLDELAHVDRRGDHPAGGVRGDVGGFVGLEAAGRLERHGLLHGRDRRDVDRDRLGRLRRPFSRGSPTAPGASQRRASSDEHRGGVQANLDPGGCERWWRVLSWPCGGKRCMIRITSVTNQLLTKAIPERPLLSVSTANRTGRSVARAARVPVRRRRQEVREHEPIAFDDDAGHSRDRARKHGAGSDAGVKLAAFTAGIGRGWQVGQERPVEGASGERRRDGTRIDRRSAALRGRRRSSRAPAPAWDGSTGEKRHRPLAARRSSR